MTEEIMKAFEDDNLKRLTDALQDLDEGRISIHKLPFHFRGGTAPYTGDCIAELYSESK